jgi:phosphoenolpyruvate---glycerone phosphotransferase subunit DhaL
MLFLQTTDIKAIIREMSLSMQQNKELLTQLDSAMGDGDLGITMTKAFSAAAEEAENSSEGLPGKLLMRMGMVIAKAAPSTLGTLIATGFMRGGKAIEEAADIDLKTLSLFFQAFVKAIMERGKSMAGNKTIIDTLLPVALALSAAVERKDSLQDAMKRAVEAARQGLLDSTQMKAQYGRAAYYQDASRGRQDGGATVGVLLVEAFCKSSA